MKNLDLSNEQKKKICLCMIVKNESQTIERCLNSAISIIDYVSICDTGSIDHTPEIITNWCKEHNIPGTVHHKPFKNFGYNRSLSALLAQKTYPEADYLLLLDADMVLEVDPNFNKSCLNHDYYITPQYDDQIKYWLTRLLKTSLPWRSVGVTHEYWDIDYARLKSEQYQTNRSSGKLDSLVVFDQRDGGSRSDKFERDKVLLLEGVNDPTTPFDLKVRYLFYLGQTYFCLENYEESIIWYKKRVDAGGWAEEVFYSLFQIAKCYENLSNSTAKKIEIIQNEKQVNQNAVETLSQQKEQFFSLAVLYYQEAWEYRPSRAEPLYHLARMYRLKSKNNTALLYAVKGKEIPFPNDDLLFVDFHMYDYLFDYEISIAAFYVEGKQELGSISQKLLESKIDTLPINIANSVKRNTKFYK